MYWVATGRCRRSRRFAVAGMSRCEDERPVTADREVARRNIRHFPGSACLYWDRSQESGTQTETSVSPPRSGLLLCADTAMVQPHQRGFTFQWSVPNMVRFKALLTSLHHSTC